ncbi:type II secretory pathway pseudopilin PulG [Pseudomonas nitritireducens]|uniref:Type II secretory pathway pseudopilin PulG n=1 Tax=Pseudomonas nitroreducens TaxID=46680 RepID=A0A7W7KT18_PSENT|nr:prepilin-type N-terminal cleavage/methylation domain-containing protein [Pseudomonas nitritireducens]MBB4867813.1 type II secretory pathway pseudopilin PulG [Pseudomonas nitritireducens]
MKRQNGYTLIELILALGLAAFVSMMGFQSDLLELDQAKARITGAQLYQYNNAVAAWTTANAGASNATYTDTNWLKSTTCPGGTSAVSYLPCSFPAGNALDPFDGGKLSITAAITTTGTAPNLVTTVTTTTTPYVLSSGRVRSDLGSLAGFVALAGAKSYSPSVASTGRQVISNASSGVLTMVTTNNSSNNSWLRTDGGNAMNNNLRFNTASAATARELKNVSRIQALAATSLTLGNPGGAASGYSVAVDANETTSGAVTIQNAQNAANGLILDTGRIRTLAGNASASNQVVAGTNGIAAAFVDSQDGAYYSIPSGNTVLNVARFNHSLQTPALYDLNDGNYRAIPSGSSVFWTPSTYVLTVFGNTNIFGMLDTAEFFQLPTNASHGAPCSPEGLVKTEPNGMINVCQNGVWNRSYYDFTSLYTVQASPAPAGTRTTNLGAHRYCALAGFSNAGTVGDAHCSVSESGGVWYIQERTTGNVSSHMCQISCMDL